MPPHVTDFRIQNRGSKEIVCSQGIYDPIDVRFHSKACRIYLHLPPVLLKSSSRMQQSHVVLSTEEEEEEGRKRRSREESMIEQTLTW
jgi:hypothetical protein